MLQIPHYKKEIGYFNFDIVCYIRIIPCLVVFWLVYLSHVQMPDKNLSEAK